MTLRTILGVATLTAALIFALGTSSAVGLRSLSVAGSTTLTLNGVITFETGVATTEIICSMTVVKTISRVIPKIERTLIGQVTDIRTNRPGEANCHLGGGAGGLERITILGLARPEPWRLFFRGFDGSLPNIQDYLIFVVRSQIQFQISRVACLYEGEIGFLAEVDAAGNIELLLPLANIVTLVAGTRILCPNAGQFRGILIPLQTTRIRLI
jgi:hypothetical protein